MISLDSEFNGLDQFHGSKPYFVTICDEAGENTFWETDVDPITREPQWPSDDLEEIREALHDQDVVLQGPRSDIRALDRIGISGKKWQWKRTYCTLLAAHLLGSNDKHDLTSQALIRLGVNIEPLEARIKKATTEARKLVQAKKNRDKYGNWKIAKEGLSDMPSVKAESKARDANGVPGSSPWKADMFLPRAIAKFETENGSKDYPLVYLKNGDIDRKRSHYFWFALRDYGNGDSSVTLPLFLKQKEMLVELDLWDIYLERLKLPLPIYELEEYGLSYNLNRLNEVRVAHRNESNSNQRVCDNIARSYGKEVVLPKAGMNNSLKSFLLDTLKLPVLSKTKGGGPCLDQKVMEQYTLTLPPRSKSLCFINSLMAKKKLDTQITYMNGYERFGLPNEHWRAMLGEDNPWFVVHTSLNPTASDTLRWGSSKPNLQNISALEMDEEDENDKTLRYLFGPAPGREWWSLDYENIELRIPAYVSGEKAMIEVLEKPNDAPYFGSYHLMNASIVYPELFWPLADKKGAFKKQHPLWYRRIKAFGFSISYGAIAESGTADKAAHKVGAQQMVMDKLKEHSKLNKQMIDFANQHGYVNTLPDKTVNPRRGYPLVCSRSRWGGVKPTIPLNYFVQGTAMWCTSKAMPRCYDYLKTLKNHYMAMQVHDELLFDFPVGGTKNLPKVHKLQALMEKSGEDVGVPLRVSISYHPNNWGESVIV